MNKKLLYSAPEAELLVVRFEENFCQSPFSSTDNTETLIDDGDEDL